MSILRTSTAVLLLFLNLCLIHPSAQAEPDSLWNKAVDMFERSSQYVPGKMVMTTDIKTKDGEVEESSVMHIRVFQDDNNVIQTEIIRAEQNGKDITEDARKEAESEKADKEDDSGDSVSFSKSSDSNVFCKSCQKDVTVRSLNRHETIGGMPAAAYEFTYTPTDQETMKGTAWLDKTTGRPLKVESVPDPLPKHVKEMTSVDWYSLNDQDLLILTKTEMSGVGGFLFIKRWFSTRIEFSNHFKVRENTSP